jgi:peptidoglycan/xylan/chitin deacetylase (PgdA/CDA1 family)
MSCTRRLTGPPTALGRLVLAVLLAVVVLAAACRSSPGQPASPATSGPARTPSPSASSPGSPPAGSASPPASPASAPAGPATLLTRGPSGGRTVFLTFDAGTDTGFAAQILDTLQRERVTAAFGITGRWAEQNPDLVRRIVGEGHDVVNHTYDHRSFTGVSTHAAALSAAQRRTEIDRADQVLSGLTGRTTRPWFRLPYGDGNGDATVSAEVGQNGYRYVLGWTVDSLGWQGLSATAITTRCLARAVPGAIYLFHVGSQSQDAQALPAVIDGLRAQGYAFGRLGDLCGGACGNRP